MKLQGCDSVGAPGALWWLEVLDGRCTLLHHAIDFAKLRTKTRYGIAVLCSAYNASSSEFLLSIYCWHNLPRDLTELADLCISNDVLRCCVCLLLSFSLLCAWNKIPCKAKRAFGVHVRVDYVYLKHNSILGSFEMLDSLTCSKMQRNITAFRGGAII